MNVTIRDDQGREIGNFTTLSEGTLWRDLLLYASTRWEAEAAERQGKALEAVLASRE